LAARRYNTNLRTRLHSRSSEAAVEARGRLSRFTPDLATRENGFRTGSPVKGRRLGFSSLSRCGNANSFSWRDQVIDGFGGFGNGELDALDCSVEFISARPVVR
jgi:hypothetical protein